jgi:hypothetical protein
MECLLIALRIVSEVFNLHDSLLDTIRDLNLILEPKSPIAKISYNQALGRVTELLEQNSEMVEPFERV